ncbi:13637_t:CDS:2, partial [Gigaspora rosea]
MLDDTSLVWIPCCIKMLPILQNIKLMLSIVNVQVIGAAAITLGIGESLE